MLGCFKRRLHSVRWRSNAENMNFPNLPDDSAGPHPSPEGPQAHLWLVTRGL